MQDALGAEKIEAIGIEYSYLLTSQLDSQRAFYEEQIADLRTQMEHLSAAVRQLTQEREEEKKTIQANAAAQKVQEEKEIAALQAEIAKMRGKAEKSAEVVTRFTKELKEERAVSKGLMENLERASHSVEQLGKEKLSQSERIHELEEQVRDIMFALEARDKIESGQGHLAEAIGGSIGVANQRVGNSKIGKTKRK